MRDVGRGGWLSGNELVPYPFEDGQVLLSGGESCDSFLQKAVESFLLDAAVFVGAYDASWPDMWPVVRNIRASTIQVSFDLCFGGSASPVSVPNFSGSFLSVSGHGANGAYALTFGRNGVRQLIEMRDSLAGLTGDLRLCARCVTCRPLSLRSIDGLDGVKPKDDGPHFSAVGDVVVVPGNNMTFKKPQNGDAAPCAVPGAGMGTIPCECEDTPLASQQICSPDGHSRIFNDTCYDIVPSIETNTDGSGSDERIGVLRVNAKCTACCTCQMYESIVNDRLAPMYEAIKKAKADIDKALAMYEDGVAKFNARVATPSVEDISVSLTGTPIGRELGSRLSGTGVNGKMGRCAFTSIVRNSAFRKIRVTLGNVTATDKVVEVSISWTDENGAPQTRSSDLQWALAGAEFVLNPGRSMVVTFVAVKDDMVGEAKADSGYTGGILLGFDYWDDEGMIKHIVTLRRSAKA